MTCKRNNRSKTTNSRMKALNFVKELLRKWVGSKKNFSLVSISMEGKAIWGLAFSIILLASSNFYSAYKGVDQGNVVSNVTIDCKEMNR